MVFAIEDEKGFPYEAESEIIKIGRRKDCQIVLTASEISREHIEVLMEKGKICVRPLTTSNICRLNGNELKKATPVKPGDKLNMGGTEFLVTKARPALPV
jgi:pSer/pThr/pTyr-binding forkhead associated (FHA) protein